MGIQEKVKAIKEENENKVNEIKTSLSKEPDSTVQEELKEDVVEPEKLEEIMINMNGITPNRRRKLTAEWKYSTDYLVASDSSYSYSEIIICHEYSSRDIAVFKFRSPEELAKVNECLPLYGFKLGAL